MDCSEKVSAAGSPKQEQSEGQNSMRTVKSTPNSEHYSDHDYTCTRPSSSSANPVQSHSKDTVNETGNAEEMCRLRSKILCQKCRTRAADMMITECMPIICVGCVTDGLRCGICNGQVKTAMHLQH